MGVTNVQDDVLDGIHGHYAARLFEECGKMLFDELALKGVVYLIAFVQPHDMRGFGYCPSGVRIPPSELKRSSRSSLEMYAKIAAAAAS